MLVTLLVLASVAWFASYRSHRVTSFVRQHLALDLAVTPFGSSPADIAGITPSTDGGSPGPGALVWYVTSDPPSRNIIASYGFSNGRLAEIRVTHLVQGWGKTDQSSARIASFLYSISPRLLYALRGTSETGEFRFSDPSASLQSMSACNNTVNPFFRVFTITPNSQ